MGFMDNFFDKDSDVVAVSSEELHLGKTKVAVTKDGAVRILHSSGDGEDVSFTQMSREDSAKLRAMLEEAEDKAEKVHQNPVSAKHFSGNGEAEFLKVIGYLDGRVAIVADSVTDIARVELDRMEAKVFGKYVLEIAEGQQNNQQDDDDDDE